MNPLNNLEGFKKKKTKQKTPESKDTKQNKNKCLYKIIPWLRTTNQTWLRLMVCVLKSVCVTERKWVCLKRKRIRDSEALCESFKLHIAQSLMDPVDS